MQLAFRSCSYGGAQQGTDDNPGAEQQRKGGVRCRTTWRSGTGARITSSAVGGMVTGSGPWRGSRGIRWSSGRKPRRGGPRRGPGSPLSSTQPPSCTSAGPPSRWPAPAAAGPSAPPGCSAPAWTGGAGLLGAGVACGIAGLFPVYLSGASLASDPANLVPHAIYLATWLASGLLIVAGGTWRRVGALLGLGTSVVTFGYLFADLG